MANELLELFRMEEQKDFPIHLALNSMHDVVIIFDKESRVLYANDAYVNVFNFSKEKILGKKVSEFEPKSPGLRVLETGEARINFYSYVESANKDVVGNITPLFDNGEVIGAVCVMRTIDSLFKLNNDIQKMEEIPFWKRSLLNCNIDPVFRKLQGVNEEFNRCLQMASHVSKTDASVLLLGKTGVGKEVFAKSIHQASNKKNGPFIPINMAAIPETLIESELFGYEEGAFTGASKKGRVGKFEQANGGTLFLDEIGEMSLSMQTKLLRAIQEKVIQRIGGEKLHKFDARIIAATNRNLEEMIRKGEFRADLYYRLNIITINIPSLMERKEDIKILSHHLLEKINRKYKKSTVFSQDVLKIFETYKWPGNVRELQSTIEHMVILANSPVLEIQLIPSYILNNQKQESCKKLIDVGINDEETNLHILIGNLECKIIKKVLKVAKTKTEAIQMLGISRRAFYQKLRLYDIDEIF